MGESISKALKKGGRFHVTFVVLEQQGRVRPEDQATMKVVLEAMPSVGTNYSVVVNQLGQGVMNKIKNEANFKTDFLSALFGELPNPTSSIFFCPRREDLDGLDNQVVKLDPDLLKFLKEGPELIMKPNEAGEVDSSTFDDVK